MESELLTSKEVAFNLGISLNAFYTLKCRRKIQAVKVEKGIMYFYLEQFEQEVKIYYPLKTTETFYIYESKMNEK